MKRIENSENRVTSRRGFVRLLQGALAAVVAGPVLYVVGRYLSPPRPLGAVTSAGPESAIPPGGSKIVKVGLKDAFVARRDDGSIYALDLACTHAGCAVAWQPDRKEFLCPCHDGRFSHDGAVLDGPPRIPLHRLGVEVKNGLILVSDDHV
jgi:cytochrome b6-f complex iron-sulfur subunit